MTNDRHYAPYPVKTYAHLDYNRREKQRIAARNDRIVHVVLYAIATMMFGFAFAVFGWAAANLPSDEPIISPFPDWTFTFLLGAVALLCFAKMGFFLFAFLDELLLGKHHPRRITGKRR